jgi:hypothetical protein
MTGVLQGEKMGHEEEKQTKKRGRFFGFEGSTEIINPAALYITPMNSPFLRSSLFILFLPHCRNEAIDPNTTRWLFGKMGEGAKG